MCLCMPVSLCVCIYVDMCAYVCAYVDVGGRQGGTEEEDIV